MAFLVLDNLSKRFGDIVAVNALTLSVQRGEFVSLLGPSGCGKTTTLQMIAGLYEPSGGSVSLDGRDITREPPNRRGLGVVFQSYALFPHMTAAENVSFGLEMRGVKRAPRREKVAAALAQVRLDGFADRFPRQLSGGQRQRVALARALVIEPALLLLDEPLSNLDAKLREEMQLELRLLQQSLGVTTILVTHDQSEALSMSDRVVVMNGGEVVQIDTPVAMYESPANVFVSSFVGKTNLFTGRIAQYHCDADAGLALIDLGAGASVKARVAGAEIGTEVSVSLRPEKLHLMDAGDSDNNTGLDGTVDAAIFLGDRWLYKLSSPLGDVILTEPNRGSGTAARRRGDAVRLSWAADAARVLKQV